MTVMCRLYGVTRAGYYAWRHREPSKRAQANEQLWKKIQHVHAKSRDTYGSPRVHEALKASGERASKGRVERLMRNNALKARAAKIYRSNPAHHAFYASIPNHQLEKIATAPDQVWVGDVTYCQQELNLSTFPESKMSAFQECKFPGGGDIPSPGSYSVAETTSFCLS